MIDTEDEIFNKEEKKAILDRYDWNGMRKEILVTLKKYGLSIPIVPEDHKRSKNAKN